MPASKPVADPARSTDPRDYQRVGRPLGVMAKTFPAGFVVAEHRHERAQLIHALSGVIELHVGRTLWLVPPQRAVWMPAGMAHAMLARGEVRLHTVYVRPQSCPPEFPRVPRGVMVSPLLRELIVRAAGLPDSPRLIGEPVRWPLLARGNLDQGPQAALEFVQSFVAARMEESERSRCLWLVGLPAIRFAGEGDEGSLFRELQVDGLGATWAVPGLEALMEEPALKGELWRAMRRVRQRWSSEIQ